MRGTVVDLGSHTFHALVADVDVLGIRRVVLDRKIATRLGEASYPGREIPRAAYGRALDAFGELIERAAPGMPHRVQVVATGVFRDARNGTELLTEMAERHGVAVELLDGRDEARLTWLAVSAELAGSHGRLAIVDLGGGSLELASGEAHVDRVHSLPLGLYRLPRASAPELRLHVLATAGHAIGDLHAPPPETVALASATARALLALARRLGLVAKQQRHVSARAFGELARRIAPLSPEALDVLGVPRARCATIAAGATAIATVLDGLGRPLVYVARSALREGVLIEAARRAQLTLSAIRAVG